jgi:hypothetical protein
MSDFFTGARIFQTLCRNRTGRHRPGQPSYKLSEEGRMLLGFLLPRISSAFHKLPGGEALDLLTYLLDLGANLDRYVCDGENTMQASIIQI